MAEYRKTKEWNPESERPEEDSSRGKRKKEKGMRKKE